MGIISSELLSFKASMDGQINNLSGKCDNLLSKIQNVSNSCNSAKSGLSSYYNSENADIVLGTFDSLNSVYSQIESSISGTLRSIISEASSLLDDIKQLEEINEVIEEYKNLANRYSKDTDEARRNRSNYLALVNTKETEFKELHEKALNKLSSLKSVSDDLGSIGEGVSGSGEGIEEGSLVPEISTTGGKFEKASYKAQNGVTVNYYIYVPDVVDTTEKLPITIYFHGVGDTVDKNTANNFKYGGGLAGLIQQEVVKPKGIVIFPQATDGTKDIDFCNYKYEEAVLELTRKTAEEYNGDLNKLSVSGHSNGGTATYKIVNNFPGTFAAAAPIAGVGNVNEGVKQTALWAFQGSQDPMVKQSTGLRVAIKCQKMGCNSKYYVYKGKGHDIQTMTYQDKFDDGTGNEVSLIDWLMSQTLNG